MVINCQMKNCLWSDGETCGRRSILAINNQGVCRTYRPATPEEIADRRKMYEELVCEDIKEEATNE